MKDGDSVLVPVRDLLGEVVLVPGIVSWVRETEGLVNVWFTGIRSMGRCPMWAYPLRLVQPA